MTHVYVGIGSNIDRHRNIIAGLEALAASFGELTLSSVYESEAVGFEGDHFYNLVAAFDTDLRVGELARRLREIEQQNGRLQGSEKFSPRTLDIDILTYGRHAGVVEGVLLPRSEILYNAYVLQPLAEIAAGEIHPLTGMCYRDIWNAYGKGRQALWVVDFSWRGVRISPRDGHASGVHINGGGR